MYQATWSGAVLWFYPTPKDAAKEIAGRVAFWKGVKVEAIEGIEAIEAIEAV